MSELVSVLFFKVKILLVLLVSVGIVGEQCSVKYFDFKAVRVSMYKCINGKRVNVQVYKR